MPQEHRNEHLLNDLTIIGECNNVFDKSDNLKSKIEPWIIKGSD